MKKLLNLGKEGLDVIGKRGRGQVWEGREYYGVENMCKQYTRQQSNKQNRLRQNVQLDFKHATVIQQFSASGLPFPLLPTYRP